MIIKCEACQRKIQENAILIITPEKSFIFCKFCGLFRNGDFSPRSEIFEIRKIKNKAKVI